MPTGDHGGDAGLEVGHLPFYKFAMTAILNLGRREIARPFGRYWRRATRALLRTIQGRTPISKWQKRSRAIILRSSPKKRAY